METRVSAAEFKPTTSRTRTSSLQGVYRVYDISHLYNPLNREGQCLSRGYEGTEVETVGLQLNTLTFMSWLPASLLRRRDDNDLTVSTFHRMERVSSMWLSILYTCVTPQRLSRASCKINVVSGVRFICLKVSQSKVLYFLSQVLCVLFSFHGWKRLCLLNL